VITIKEKKEQLLECPIRKWFAGEKRANKHRDLLEEVIGRGDKHVRIAHCRITCKKPSATEHGIQKEGNNI